MQACLVQKVVANKIHWTGIVQIQDMHHFILLASSVCAISFAFTYEPENKNINFLELPAGIERKQAFIDFLQPIIEEKNLSLLQDRQKLTRLSKKVKLNIREQRWLRHIGHLYNNNKFNTNDESHWAELFSKVDLIPASLVVAQGAKESGWGISRFVQQGNNYFGQWCYKTGCGLVPKDRNQSADHEVAKYKSVQESVTNYINNLNTHSAYITLREIRERLRKTGQAVTGHHLAYGLQHYSERGQIYIEEIQALIRNNKLDMLEKSS
ncbi:MAG: glucosaminidase domain-containing protein [Gammaproteobacteria bacterium]|nr:glucosaminidase domain-containing protein [Gammaproteobacteria bacterium]